MPNEDSHILPLKNGSHAKVRHALAELSHLEYLLAKEPHHFEVLLKLVQGAEKAPDEVDDPAYRESIRFLKQDGSIVNDGTVQPLLRDVLLSGYQVTPEGPVISQPFALTCAHEKLIVDVVERRMDASRERWMRRFPPPDQDNGPSL